MKPTKKPVAKKKLTAGKTARKHAGERQPFETQDAALATRHFQGEADKIASAEVETCRADVDLARINVDRGVASIRTRLDVVQKKLPLCPIADLLELPALVRALGYVAA